MIAWRDAGPGDGVALAALFARCFTDTFGHLYAAKDLAMFLAGQGEDGWVQQLADPAYAVRLGEVDGAAVAFAKLGPPALPVRRRGQAAELRQLYVLADHHGSGAGQTLMDWAIAAARARGASELFLSVYVDNHRARRFYARQGFEEVGTYAFMVGTQRDEDILLRMGLRPQTA
ncbi:GNAT family N-acetyltransferase [Sphingomonas sp. KR1UV-12]|uniref:GNAT family N-acetyltransferase n=1 Tax=Sphingomonas aurea TaxID=3063994 RepID=A0ABT9EM80_9SPHN|nr:GNAT family N-acetyltransferase [Sphingomonas sp. KR1UV-12]MDP1027965.1 GNAT family N-acetyltransferase [Sphingomonas sp. KR1UV-12]